MLKSFSSMCITENSNMLTVYLSLCGNGSCVNVYLHSVSTLIQRDEHTHTLMPETTNKCSDGEKKHLKTTNQSLEVQYIYTSETLRLDKQCVNPIMETQSLSSISLSDIACMACFTGWIFNLWPWIVAHICSDIVCALERLEYTSEFCVPTHFTVSYLSKSTSQVSFLFWIKHTDLRDATAFFQSCETLSISISIKKM